MDTEAHRDLKLLDAIANDARVTQRSLATKLGIALGLTNLYLKRLARKGYIKLVNISIGHGPDAGRGRTPRLLSFYSSDGPCLATAC